MALKKSKKENINVTVETLKMEINNINNKIHLLSIEREEKRRQLLELEIKPFKIGDYALVKVPSGKSYREQKCLLECVDGTLYARPVKANGELSSRHFSVIPVRKPYSEMLKEVE